MEDESSTGIEYQCLNCSEKISSKQLAVTPEIKCPFCGYRVLRKIRPPVVKRLKAI